eukprot:29848-Pelagococcus_subviridis.AAC.1
MHRLDARERLKRLQHHERAAGPRLQLRHEQLYERPDVQAFRDVVQRRRESPLRRLRGAIRAARVGRRLVRPLRGRSIIQSDECRGGVQRRQKRS